MKRHPALVPLSREHHTGLVMAQRLILGRSTNPRSPWPSEVHGQADRLLRFFQEELQPHFDFEETELFARLLEWPTEAALPWQPLLQDLVRDHAVMRAMINE
ncbi:MAG: hemerythrin domain-containing protein, partial [Vicinamibacterales bacterium]